MEGGLLYLGSKRNVFKLNFLSKSEQWLLRKSISSFGTLSWIKEQVLQVLLQVLLDRNTVVALASAEISIGLASWGQAN